MMLQQYPQIWKDRAEKQGHSLGSISQLTADLAAAVGISPLLARLLGARGMSDEGQARQFLYGDISTLPSPSSMHDLEKAAKRIARGVIAGERGCCMADFDADGIGSGALIAEFFSLIGAHMEVFVPSREQGYGLNEEAIRDAARRGITYIISVDCGISNVDEAALARDLGLDLIITDHHQVPETVPDAYAVVNPHQPWCEFPYKELCGAGVAFYLACAVRKELREQGFFHRIPEPDVRSLLDLCTISTVADLVPLTGVNRVLVKAGLAYMNQCTRVGLEALRQVAEVKKYSSGTIGFNIGPRLNASGRIDHAIKGVNLLLENDWHKALPLAQELDSINRERRAIEKHIVEEAEAMIAAGQTGKKSIVLAKEGWEPGCVGLAASRLTEKYHVPTVIISLQGGEGKGSARSIPAFNLFENLAGCADLLIRYGGHAMAAGLQLSSDMVEAFAQRLDNLVSEKVSFEGLSPTLYYDLDLDINDVTIPLVEELRWLEPYGMGNPSPTFVVRGVEACNVKVIGSDMSHLKFRAQNKNRSIDCIAFSQADKAYELEGRTIDILFTPTINDYMGRQNVQMEVKSLRPSQIRG